MSDKFVPLHFPGAGLTSAAPPSRARILSARRGAADAPAMQPLLAEAAPIAAAPRPAPAPHPAHGEPRIQVQREGDKIIGIQIQCGCGQVIDLECKY